MNRLLPSPNRGLGLDTEYETRTYVAQIQRSPGPATRCEICVCETFIGTTGEMIMDVAMKVAAHEKQSDAVRRYG